MKKKVVIFVSGSGSNMENIINYFKGNRNICVTHVFTNKPNCLAVTKAKNLHIPVTSFTKQELENQQVENKLRALNPNLIVLAGFLLKIPASFVTQFPYNIINVHPSLLPKFGGKGMYGKFVHEAVIKANEKQSGITIHYVNEQYDEGNIIAQFSVELSPKESVKTLQEKIHGLEQQHFPKVIENLLNE